MICFISITHGSNVVRVLDDIANWCRCDDDDDDDDDGLVVVAALCSLSLLLLLLEDDIFRA